jgi:hypothetical protein
VSTVQKLWGCFPTAVRCGTGTSLCFRKAIAIRLRTGCPSATAVCLWWSRFAKGACLPTACNSNNKKPELLAGWLNAVSIQPPPLLAPSCATSCETLSCWLAVHACKATSQKIPSRLQVPTSLRPILLRREDNIRLMIRTTRLE